MDCAAHHLLALLAVLCLSGGCTSMSLKRQLISHSESSSDIRYREAIENLAMIAYSPSSLPSFSTIFSGTTDVSDSVQISSQTVWNRSLLKPAGSATTFGTESLDIPTSRTIKKNWTLDPTVIPEKLRAMRAACVWVLFGPEAAGDDAFWLKRYEEEDDDPPGNYFDVANKLASIRPGWLHVGHRPQNEVLYSAQCHGTYVCVEPSGLGRLSEFVLVLQSIARADFGSTYFPHLVTRSLKLSQEIDVTGGKVKDITVYVDDKGHLTPGDGIPSVPRKTRVDNVGLNSDLRSVINATVKSP